MTAQLKELQRREKEKLKGEESVPGYYTDRDWLAPLVSPFIRNLLKAGSQPKIIEIGCGSGESIKKILSDHTELRSGNISGTSLSELSGHKLLRDLGVTVYTSIMAEALPESWAEQFDIVMACLVMCHTELSEAVPQIMRIIKPNGHFIGYENPVIASNIKVLAEQCADITFEKLPSVSWELRPFAIQKH